MRRNVPYKCINCGAPIQWDRSSDHIKCDFCGTFNYLENNNYLKLKSFISSFKNLSWQNLKTKDLKKSNLFFVIPLFFLLILFISSDKTNQFKVNNEDLKNEYKNNENLKIRNKKKHQTQKDPIFDDYVTVGILHSLSGTMAISESTLVDAEKMAIAEINESGGVKVGDKKYKIEYIIEDGKSDWPTFAKKSKSLIDIDGVPVVFGGWTSASRKAMLPVFESRNSLLFYPIVYEGQECSKNIFYTGATPNQQAVPAAEFMFRDSPAAGKPFYLVGSDYIFPRVVNNITKNHLKKIGGKVVGEDYLPLGNTEVAPIISKIKKTLPNGGVIINTLNGNQLISFFQQLRDRDLTTSNGYYVMNYSITEEEITVLSNLIGNKSIKGHYAAWNYMQNINTSASRKFVSNFKKRYGSDRLVTDPQESAYNMVYLWKKGVEKANTFVPAEVRKALVGIRFNAPQGSIQIMPNHHIKQKLRIGKINQQSGFTIVRETSQISPKTWSQKLPSSKGYTCDWTDLQKGRRYRL